MFLKLDLQNFSIFAPAIPHQVYGVAWKIWTLCFTQTCAGNVFPHSDQVYNMTNREKKEYMCHKRLLTQTQQMFYVWIEVFEKSWLFACFDSAQICMSAQMIEIWKGWVWVTNVARQFELVWWLRLSLSQWQAGSSDSDWTFDSCVPIWEARLTWSGHRADSTCLKNHPSVSANRRRPWFDLDRPIGKQDTSTLLRFLSFLGKKGSFLILQFIITKIVLSWMFLHWLSREARIGYHILAVK